MAEDKNDTPQTPEPIIETAERAAELGESIRKGIDVAPQASIPACSVSSGGSERRYARTCRHRWKRWRRRGG